MSKDILMLVQALSNEKELEEAIVFEALETALAAAAAKRYPEGTAVRVAINRKTGDYETFRRWTVVEEIGEEGEGGGEGEEGGEEGGGTPAAQQISLPEAKKIDPNLQADDIVEESIENPPFGRIAAQQAKQVLRQAVREAERDKIAKQYQARIGDLLLGTVKRVTRENIILDMGNNVEALLLREEMLFREAFRLNDRARVYLYQVRNEKRGPQLLVSRTRPEFLIALFKIEVPEIAEGIIEIKAAARDPGLRAKIAVKTNDGRVDPIGACVGMRGARVQAVSNALAGERIDIVLWDDSPAQFVINAMAPAEVSSIIVDEEAHAMDISVPADQLSQAIGRTGQNIRLASELTTWTLNVMSEDQAAEKQATEASSVKEAFLEQLDVDEEVAIALVEEGFTRTEEIAYAPASEILTIEGFDEDIVEALQKRANDYVLMKSIATQEELANMKPSDSLLSLEGMTQQIAEQLAENDIKTRDDLADQSVSELQELINIDAELAAQLIMQAREHWFVSDEAEGE